MNTKNVDFVGLCKHIEGEAMDNKNRKCLYVQSVVLILFLYSLWFIFRNCFILNPIYHLFIIIAAYYAQNTFFILIHVHFHASFIEYKADLYWWAYVHHYYDTTLYKRYWWEYRIHNLHWFRSLNYFFFHIYFRIWDLGLYSWI
eukprot:UN03907